jgi:hypothetical protein
MQAWAGVPAVVARKSFALPALWQQTNRDTHCHQMLSPPSRWRALRESNPCFRRERAMSWTARRRAHSARAARGNQGARHIKAFAKSGKEVGPANARPSCPYPFRASTPLVWRIVGHGCPARESTRGPARGGTRMPDMTRRATISRYWASTPRAPSAAAASLSAEARSSACRASARTPWSRRAAAG